MRHLDAAHAGVSWEGSFPVDRPGRWTFTIEAWADAFASWREELDVPALADIACMSRAHFIRSFKDAFGETPHRYLQRRRLERAMYLLRATRRSVTDICLDVGFTSLGTFSRTFSAVVGESPSAYRLRGTVPDVPTCIAMRWSRPAGFGEAPRKIG